jgi:hypothetical protein
MLNLFQHPLQLGSFPARGLASTAPPPVIPAQAGIQSKINSFSLLFFGQQLRCCHELLLRVKSSQNHWG